MLFAGVAIICFLSVPLARGRLGLLAHYAPKGAVVAVIGLALQIVIISILPKGSTSLHTAAHLSSYVLVGWVIWANRHLPWLWLIGVGGGLNFVAIVANGGVMPASASAARAAGLVQESGQFINSTVLEHPRLLFLGDVFGSSLPWPNNVFSAGDIVMAVAAFLMVHTLCGSALSSKRLHYARQARRLARAAG
jgi:hypothetical protein